MEELQMIVQQQAGLLRLYENMEKQKRMEKI